MPESTVSEAVVLNKPPLSEPSSGASLVSDPQSIVSNVIVLRSLTDESVGFGGEVGEVAEADEDGEKRRVSLAAGSEAGNKEGT